MVRRRKRGRGTAQPRVDDLFYGNPPLEPGQDDPAPAAGDADPDLDTSPPGTGPGEVLDPPEEAVSGDPEKPESEKADAAPGDAEAGDSEDGHGVVGPLAGGEEHSYAARADRGTPEQAEEARRLTRRGRFGTAGRWARAAGIAALAAALVYGAGSGRVGTLDLADALDRQGPTPAGTDRPAGLAVLDDSTLGCVGPGLVGLDDPSVPEPEQGASVAAGSAPTEALPEGVASEAGGAVSLGGVPDGATAEANQRGEVLTLAVEGSRWVRGAAEGTLAAGFAATQLGYSFEEQQWGMATAACGMARDDLWLVAGGAEAGRVERLILANPTGNPITVTAEVLGAAGPVSVVGGTGIVVPPAGRQVVLLDALAPGEERPVVHVTTTGGPVVAALGDRWLEGTIDRGAEVTTPAASPATSLVIPAVPAPRPDTADTASVRVAVPGAETGVVQLRALTADGPVRLEQGVTTVEPGAVADIDVADLPAGTQGIEVTADTPVVAAAQVQRRDEAGGTGDLAWIPAVTPSSGLQGAPLATSVDGAIAGSLNITSLQGARIAVVTVVDGTVTTTELAVPAASTRTVELAKQTESVWLHPLEGTVSAGVISTLEHDLGLQIAGLPLPTAPVTREVRAIAPWLP
ncbi:DUF5719 family protein [Ornithinimicrobium murale]|uniref:DUF5719 family protein n=1 Tax=Ornithinimicrobium murale TaxID=1050153 RepID=UPI000E0D9436|nr:DUF5719 family protein [Ornithinimicrobium murale]